MGRYDLEMRKSEGFRAWEWVSVFLLGALSFFHSRGGAPRPWGNSSGPVPSLVPGDVQTVEVEQRILLFFLIDFRDLMCPGCLESLADVYESLPPECQRRKSVGVFLLGEGDAQSPDWVIDRKVQGFVRGHNLTCPVLVDRRGVWQRLGEGGSGIVLLDFIRRDIRAYRFPLTPGEVAEILDRVYE